MLWETAVGISRLVSLQTSLRSLWCPVQMLWRKVHERPGAQGRQRRPLREALALLSAKKSPGQKHLSVPAACLYPHLLTKGGSVGLVWGHGELQRTGAGKQVPSEHRDLY